MILDPSSPAVKRFPDFYAHPVVEALVDTPRWTVSDKDKVPIDIRALADESKLRGAWATDEQCLMTLEELNEVLPEAANNAFYLRSQMDGYLVLDIEPTCPSEVLQKLLSLPCLYAERSMSGRGYHLVMEAPDNFWDFPAAVGKRVLREEHGWYEVLLEHWVTFTRNQVDLGTPTAEPGAWEKVWESLASKAVESAAVEIAFQDRPEVAREEQIVDIITRQPINKALADFHHDHSRYEFSVLGTLYNRLSTLLVALTNAEPEEDYGPQVQAWLIYRAATEVIPARPKHQELRNDMPLMLNAALALVSRRIAEKERRQAESSP